MIKKKVNNSLKLCILIFVFITAFGACKKEQKKLPILGKKDLQKKQVNGKQVTDTVYHKIPEFRFVNQDSTIVTPATFRDKIYVADFFFTTCPTICPKMKKQMKRVYEEYKGNEEVAFLSHSIDPNHDSVEVLKNYARDLGVGNTQQWHFVTGKRTEIYQIAKDHYMVPAHQDPSAPGGVVHSGAFILVDKKRRIRGYYEGTKEKSVDELIRDIEVLLDEYHKS